MLGAPELLSTVDDEALGPGALDLSTHRDEQAAQVLDVRLARGVEDLGPPLCLDRGEQDVLGPGHRGQVEHDAVAMEAFGRGVQYFCEAIGAGSFWIERRQIGKPGVEFFGGIEEHGEGFFVEVHSLCRSDQDRE